MSVFGETKPSMKDRTTAFVRESGENPRNRLGGTGVKLAAGAVILGIFSLARGCAENAADFQNGGLSEMASGNFSAFKAAVSAEDIELGNLPNVDVTFDANGNPISTDTQSVGDPTCSDSEPHSIEFGDRIYNLVARMNPTLVQQSHIESVVFDEFTQVNPGVDPNSIAIGESIRIPTDCRVN